ncbi:hypothetical protein PIB30_075095 [Stylosanthes scabra]|uniref:Uncharacterized protein n=1 Tax=Stylosanthes scabra TaxID=79078 RepID=A0ABU6SR56_9FABA|nr:hypothetical protein [Stylosanthes scabra]
MLGDDISLDDVRKGTAKIVNVFMESYKWYAPLFSMVPDEAIDCWWNEWRIRFRKGEEANMRAAWEVRAAKRHRGLMHGIQYQAIQRTNKTNCSSSTGGSLHTGGSTTYPATKKNMTKEIGHGPTQREVFVRTNTKKKDRGKWVDKRSENYHELHRAEVKHLEEERDAVIVTGEPLLDSEDVSTASGPDTREHVTLLNREIAQLAEHYRLEMEAWHKRYETDVTRLQTTLDTQTVEFDWMKCTVSQMHTFMQQMQAVSSSSSAVAMPLSIPPAPPPPSHVSRPPQPPPTTPVPTPIDTQQDPSASDDSKYM